MLCRFLQVVSLPVVSTFWRYVNSLGINQDRELLVVMSVLRERVWQQCGIKHQQINIDIDTTVETVFGKLRTGKTVSGEETAGFIKEIGKEL